MPLINKEHKQKTTDMTQTQIEARQEKENIQKVRLLAAYRQAEALLRDLQTIETDRKFLGDWESNRKLQALAKVQLIALREINAAKEELQFIRNGLRDNDIFSPI